MSTTNVNNPHPNNPQTYHVVWKFVAPCRKPPHFIPGICMLHTPNFSHVHHWTENLSRTSHPGADRICKLQNILTKTGISLKIHENLLISFSYLLISTHIYSRMKKIIQIPTNLSCWVSLSTTLHAGWSAWVSGRPLYQVRSQLPPRHQVAAPAGGTGGCGTWLSHGGYDGYGWRTKTGKH